MQPNKFQDITLPSEDTVQLFIYVSPGLIGLRQLLECESYCGESFTYFETYLLYETHWGLAMHVSVKYVSVSRKEVDTHVVPSYR